MGRDALEILMPLSTVSIYIVFDGMVEKPQRKLLGWLLKIVMGRNALEILMPLSTMSTYIVFEKPIVSAFQNFLRIENWLNIKKVMGRNV